MLGAPYLGETYLGQSFPLAPPAPASGGTTATYQHGQNPRPAHYGTTYKKTGSVTLTLAASGTWRYDLTEIIAEDNELIAIGVF